MSDEPLGDMTATHVCDHLSKVGGAKPVDRTRPGKNMAATASVEELSRVLDSGNVGAVLIWDGWQLIGLIDWSRLTRFKADQQIPTRRQIDVDDRP